MKIYAKITTSAKRREVKKENNKFKIYLKSKPEKGKANKELISLLSSYFNVPKTSIKIVKGLYSRNKIIEIE